MGSIPKVIIALTGVLLLSTCSKEEQAETFGRFFEYQSCTVISPPEAVLLDTFYTSYLNCSGIAIVAPNGVPAEALYAADSIITFMLDGLEPVKRNLITSGAYHVLYPPGMAINELPEWRDESVNYGPGSFLAHKQVSTSTLANVLCYPAPDNRSIMDCELMHEFGHLFYELGLINSFPAFEGEITAAYNNAMALGLWGNTYSAGNVPHYFIEGMQIWYGVNTPGGPAGGNGNVNNISTRAQLRTYDPMLYNLFEEYINDRENTPVCFL